MKGFESFAENIVTVFQDKKLKFAMIVDVKTKELLRSRQNTA